MIFFALSRCDEHAPLQRVEGASRVAVPSPARLDHHGVTGPFRVLLGDEVAGSLGYPLPVRRWRWRALRPSGVPRVALA
jgi:hypothetical protein